MEEGSPVASDGSKMRRVGFIARLMLSGAGLVVLLLLSHLAG